MKSHSPWAAYRTPATSLCRQGLAVIELSVNARRRLLPGRIGVQVPCQLHGVVQHPADHDQAGFRAVDETVARSADHPHTGFHVVPAQSQVPGSHTGSEFGPREAARSVGLPCHVAERCDDQAPAAQPGGLAGLLMCPGEDVEDIALSGSRRPVARKQIDRGSATGCQRALATERRANVRRGRRRGDSAPSPVAAASVLTLARTMHPDLPIPPPCIR